MRNAAHIALPAHHARRVQQLLEGKGEKRARCAAAHEQRKHPLGCALGDIFGDLGVAPTRAIIEVAKQLAIPVILALAPLAAGAGAVQHLAIHQHRGAIWVGSCAGLHQIGGLACPRLAPKQLPAPGSRQPINDCLASL